MPIPFDVPPQPDTAECPTESATLCCAEVWGPPQPVKDAQPIEAKSLLKPSGEKETAGEAEFLKSFSPTQVEQMFAQVRRTFDKIGLESTKVTPENIRNVSRNLTTALGSDEYSVREFASRTLKELGIVALPTLVDASLTSNDLEQQKRLGRLIQPFSTGSGQHIAEERQRLDKHETAMRAFGNRIPPKDTEMRMQKQITGTPDGKIDDNLSRLEKLLDSGKVVHQRGHNRELVANRAGKIERDIEEVKKTAKANSLEKSKMRVSLASSLLVGDFNPRNVKDASKDTAALLLADAIKKAPRLLNDDKSEYQLRHAIADLKFFKHASVPQLEAAYKAAGGDPKLLEGTAHSFGNRGK